MPEQPAIDITDRPNGLQIHVRQPRKSGVARIALGVVLTPVFVALVLATAHNEEIPVVGYLFAGVAVLVGFLVVLDGIERILGLGERIVLDRHDLVLRNGVAPPRRYRLDNVFNLRFARPPDLRDINWPGKNKPIDNHWPQGALAFETDRKTVRFGMDLTPDEAAPIVEALTSARPILSGDPKAPDAEALLDIPDFGAGGTDSGRDLLNGRLRVERRGPVTHIASLPRPLRRVGHGVLALVCCGASIGCLAGAVMYASSGLNRLGLPTPTLDIDPGLFGVVQIVAGTPLFAGLGFVLALVAYGAFLTMIETDSIRIDGKRFTIETRSWSGRKREKSTPLEDCRDLIVRAHFPWGYRGEGRTPQYFYDEYDVEATLGGNTVTLYRSQNKTAALRFASTLREHIPIKPEEAGRWR